MDTESIMLKTRRLLLFALTREQLELALYDSETLGEALGIQLSPEVFSDESRQAMMIKMSRMDHANRRAHPWYTYFLLVEASGRTAVGVCGFKGAPSPLGSVELGYAMHEKQRNKGYMSEAVKALIEWAFQQEGCKTVTAETLRENYPSQHVLQNAGMVLERAAENMLYWKIAREDDRP